MAVNIPGLIGVIVFYLVILVIGLIAGRKKAKSTSSDTQFLANRDLGLFVASLTIAATNVGGAYINGTAESIGRDGLAWTIAPIFYNLGIVLAGVLIAPKVRRAGYTTIFDPLQEKYGKKMGALLFFNELLANLFWEAAILGALGTSLSLILDLDVNVAVIVSACVAIVYTFFGGLYSVAYTDLIQLFFITLGLVLALPFVFTSPSVDISRIKDTWLGTLPANMTGFYIDIICLCIFGATTWQVYYQRVLACESPSIARNATFIGTLISMVLAIPPAMIGLAGAATDWNSTSYEGDIPLSSEDWTSILPIVLQHLCPLAVSVIGLGAVSAAVMSSADSIVLACGSVMARNLYQVLIRPQASEREIVWVLRISIVIIGALGTIIALTVRSIYGLYLLCGDLMFVTQFPQIACALWLPFANTYGSLLGFIGGLLLRCFGGEPLLHIPALIKYPYYNEALGMQLFPFKTFSMLCTLAIIVSVSYLTEYLFKRKKIPLKYDVFRCFQEPAAINGALPEGEPLNILKTTEKKDDEFSGNEKKKIIAD